MSSPRYDPEELAARVMLKLDELIGGRKADTIPRRASDIASHVASMGVFQAVAFFLSKTDERVYNAVYRYIRGLEAKSDSLVKLVESELSGEGKGYSVILAVTMVGVEEAARQTGVDCSRDGNNTSTLRGVARCLLMLKESGRLVQIDAMLQPYLLTVKRLTDAFYKEKR